MLIINVVGLIVVIVIFLYVSNFLLKKQNKMNKSILGIILFLMSLLVIIFYLSNSEIQWQISSNNMAQNAEIIKKINKIKIKKNVTSLSEINDLLKSSISRDIRYITFPPDEVKEEYMPIQSVYFENDEIILSLSIFKSSDAAYKEYIGSYRLFSKEQIQVQNNNIPNYFVTYKIKKRDGTRLSTLEFQDKNVVISLGDKIKSGNNLILLKILDIFFESFEKT